MKSKDRPYMLYVAEKIYLEISKIKENNIDYTNSDAIKNFIKTKFFEKLSSGKFHDEWLEKLKNNDFIDQNDNKDYLQSRIKRYEAMGRFQEN